MKPFLSRAVALRPLLSVSSECGAGGVTPLGLGASALPLAAAGGAGTPDFTLYASITCLVMLVPPLAKSTGDCCCEMSRTSVNPCCLGVGLHHVVHLRSQACVQVLHILLPVVAQVFGLAVQLLLLVVDRSCCGWRAPHRSGGALILQLLGQGRRSRR